MYIMCEKLSFRRVAYVIFVWFMLNMNYIIKCNIFKHDAIAKVTTLGVWWPCKVMWQ